MTREEIIKSAIKFLIKMQIKQGSWGYADFSDNDVSWKDVLEWFEHQFCDKNIYKSLWAQVQWERDVAVEQLELLGYGLGEKIRTDEDCISREAVLDEIDKYIKKAQSTGTVDDFISFKELVVKQLPSVTPQPKRGKWEVIRKEYEFMGGIVNEAQGCKCSNCGGIVKFKSDFCPNCGSYNGGDSECHEDKDLTLVDIRYQCEGCINADDDDGGYNDYMCKTCVRRAKDRYFKI